MTIVVEPKVYLVGRTEINQGAVQQFLEDERAHWVTDSENGTELVSELAGRLCYMSFGERQGRRSNSEYLANIIAMEHGSVLEHAVWNFIVTGVSRSFSHELVRHRAGWGYCLAGDTQIYSERMYRRHRNGAKKRRLDHLYEMTKTPHGRSRLRLLRLRCLDEDTGTFAVGRVRAITRSGVKPVFRVELDDGKSVTCTREHRFLTPGGWQTLEDLAGGIELTSGRLVAWRNMSAEIMVNGTLAYKDRAWLEEQYIVRGLDQRAIGLLAGVSHHTIRNWIRKHGLQKPIGSWTKGVEPWNKGSRYQAGWHHTPQTRDLMREQKLGPKNPQWRGGITREATQVREEVSALRPAVLARDDYRCRLCGEHATLTIHHILPLWLRPDLALELDNPAALCRPCHLQVNTHELAYLERFGLSPEEVGGVHRPLGGGRLLVPRCQRIVGIKYAGEQMTFDLEMEAPHHNFVANGLVTHNSQLSQRFVDESDTDFVEPEIIAAHPDLHDIWLESVRHSHEAYCRLAEGLTAKIEQDYPQLTGRAKRKRAREAARSVLPNATETKIFMSANARALRHFVEYRGAPDAEPEIRRVAMQVLEIMRTEAPGLFGDYDVETLPDGSTAARTEHKKV